MTDLNERLALVAGAFPLFHRVGSRRWDSQGRPLVLRFWNQYGVFKTAACYIGTSLRG